MERHSERRVRHRQKKMSKTDQKRNGERERENATEPSSSVIFFFFFCTGRMAIERKR